MNRNEFWEYLNAVKIDETRVDAVKKVYSTNNIPEEMQKIVSVCNESIFFENNNRILSFAEILDAERDLHVDFSDKKLIPIADCGDNDFIVYDFQNMKWAKFNIVDETLFKKRDSLEEMFI